MIIGYNFNETKKSFSLDSKFVDLENTGLCATITAFKLNLLVKVGQP